MAVCYAISATKANRLYWLGRYVERAYTTLHLLRRYYDGMIDGDPSQYEDFYKRLDIYNDDTDPQTFHLDQLYGENNACSLITCVERANDNGIVLREEIKSESLSYVQMSLCTVKECAARKENNIIALQPVTDYLLAFFGSIDERVFDDRVRRIIKVGKLVELMDLHIRFDYPFKRVAEEFGSLQKCVEQDDHTCDPVIMQRLMELMKEEMYNVRSLNYKNVLLNYLNHLVLL